MKSLEHQLAEVTDTRFAIITGTAAHLIARLGELNELRERVRKAELTARCSQRIDRKIEAREKGPPEMAEHCSISM